MRTEQDFPNLPTFPAITNPAPIVGNGDMTRAEAVKRIRKALRARTGIKWSVTGSTGTAYCWLKIRAPRNLRTWTNQRNPEWSTLAGRDVPEWVLVYDDSSDFGHMSAATRAALAKALGIDARDVHDGVSIPPGAWALWIERAETGSTTRTWAPDWD